MQTGQVLNFYLLALHVEVLGVKPLVHMHARVCKKVLMWEFLCVYKCNLKK